MSRPTGDPTIVCDENGKWSDIQFTCDRQGATESETLRFFIMKFVKEFKFTNLKRM